MTERVLTELKGPTSRGTAIVLEIEVKP